MNKFPNLVAGDAVAVYTLGRCEKGVAVRVTSTTFTLEGDTANRIFSRADGNVRGARLTSALRVKPWPSKVRKHHLQHAVHRGPTCQTGRTGAALRGEHITECFAEFAARPVDLQCTRCLASKLFTFLQRK